MTAGSLYVGGEWTAPSTGGVIANDSDYGLSGSVWTADVDRGIGVARRVRTGTFGVNQPYNMDPAAPFGGVKASGFGRVLGPEGLDEFLDVKAISIAP